ncbi:hypothetical protein J8273_3721 [Carpediemonas membranifera]|uniref:Uncharacterized protein n=1 Tax=Carpediemonas membranifera TaxID=201153 RepID=A0A8J6AX78_9EUKA|nr:hypothetical protein J8273_3721 [Carpediemonas membranifera]|eukprot:KAG9394745.1 hypothetical protein J8273_3721 [Carpediemonas membranifera]
MAQTVRRRSSDICPMSSSEVEYDTEGYDDSEEEDEDSEEDDSEEKSSDNDEGSDESAGEDEKKPSKPRIQFEGFPGAIQLPVGPNCRVSICPTADDSGFSIVVSAGVHSEHTMSLTIASNVCSIGQTVSATPVPAQPHQMTQQAPIPQQQKMGTTEPGSLNNTAAQGQHSTMGTTMPQSLGPGSGHGLSPEMKQVVPPDIRPATNQISRPEMPSNIRELYKYSASRQPAMSLRTVDVYRPLSEQMADIVFQ